MTFDYKNSFNQDPDKWEQFDDFLSDLSESYPEEFGKEIYKNKRLWLLAINQVLLTLVRLLTMAYLTTFRNKYLTS